MCIWQVAGVRCPQGNVLRHKKYWEGSGMAVRDAALIYNAQMSAPGEKQIDKTGCYDEAGQ